MLTTSFQLFTYSLARLLAGSPARSFAHSFIHSFTCSFICLCCWFFALRLTSFENFCHISRYRNKLLPLSVATPPPSGQPSSFSSLPLGLLLSTLFIHLMATFAYFGYIFSHCCKIRIKLQWANLNDF